MTGERSRTTTRNPRGLPGEALCEIEIQNWEQSGSQKRSRLTTRIPICLSAIPAITSQDRSDFIWNSKLSAACCGRFCLCGPGRDALSAEPEALQNLNLSYCVERSGLADSFRPCGTIRWRVDAPTYQLTTLHLDCALWVCRKYPT